MDETIKILNSSAWTADVAMLKICCGIDDVATSYRDLSRLAIAREMILGGANKKTYPVSDLSDQARVDVFLTALDVTFKSNRQRVQMHPIVWYWFCKKKAPEAIHESFKYAIDDLIARGCTDGVNTIIQRRKSNGKWGRTDIDKAKTSRNLTNGLIIPRLMKVNFYEYSATNAVWRIRRDTEEILKDGASRSKQVEAKLIAAFQELRSRGLKKEITEYEEEEVHSCFETEVFIREDLLALIKCTQAGKELGKRKTSTITRSLSYVIKMRPGKRKKAQRDHAKRKVLELSLLAEPKNDDLPAELPTSPPAPAEAS